MEPGRVVKKLRLHALRLYSLRPFSLYSYSSLTTNADAFKHLANVRGPATTALRQRRRKQGTVRVEVAREVASYVNCRRRPALLKARPQSLLYLHGIARTHMYVPVLSPLSSLLA